MTQHAQTQLLAAIEAAESAKRKYTEGEYAKAISEAGAAVGLLRQFQDFCRLEHGTKAK